MELLPRVNWYPPSSFPRKIPQTPLHFSFPASTKRRANEIIVTSYQTNQPLDNATFKFDKKKFPNAEVIDLR